MRPAPTRRELLVAGAGVGAAALGGSGIASAASSTPKESEATRVYRLLRVELLVLFTYEHVLDSQILPPRNRRALAPLRADEQAHVRVLHARLTALGGVAPSAPANVAAADLDLAGRHVRGRLGQLQSAQDALRLLLAIERVVVGAYFVALLKLEDRQLITLCTQIMANDAQHEALIGEQLYPGDTQTAVPYGLVQGVQ